MPSEAVSAVDDVLKKHANRWAGAILFIKHPAFKRQLLSAVTWAAGGESLVYAEVLLPEPVDATVGRVEVVAFTKDTIIQVTGDPANPGGLNAFVTARRDIARVAFIEPSDLIGGALTPDPTDLGLNLYFGGDGSPLVLGMRGYSPALLEAFYPQLLEDLSR